MFLLYSVILGIRELHSYIPVLQNNVKLMSNHQFFDRVAKTVTVCLGL